MTEMRLDVAPGERPRIPPSEQGTPSGFLVYTIGLLLAVILTITSFWVANTSALWTPGVPPGLAVLAVAQMGVHLVFFLHITTGPESSNNILALAFGVIIVFLVLAGSLLIMANLNENVMAHPEMTKLHMQPKAALVDSCSVQYCRASDSGNWLTLLDRARAKELSLCIPSSHRFG